MSSLELQILWREAAFPTYRDSLGGLGEKGVSWLALVGMLIEPIETPDE